MMLPSAVFYYVTNVQLAGTTEKQVRFSSPVQRVDITTDADDILFEPISKNLMREPFIKLGANSFYSVDVTCDLIKIKGVDSAAASVVQIVGWVFE